MKTYFSLFQNSFAILEKKKVQIGGIFVNLIGFED